MRQPDPDFHSLTKLKEDAITAPITNFKSGIQIAPPQRAIGHVRVVSKQRNGHSRLADLFQSGSGKALLPLHSGQDLQVVLLNTAGGITGGDHFQSHAVAGEDSRLTLTSQAAERIYRSAGTSLGNVQNSVVVESAARADWLPQETIMFNKAALQRRLDVYLATDATFLAVEPLVFGRVAMGETLQQARLQDSIRIWQDGQLLFADTTQLRGDLAQQLSSPAIANGNFALASVVYVGADADACLADIRAILPGSGGASMIRPGLLFARILAPDSFLLRQSLIPILQRLHGQDLPRTWMM